MDKSDLSLKSKQVSDQVDVWKLFMSSYFFVREVN